MGRNKETQPGQVLTLNELVAYQTGAVVSRTLVNKKGGTVTMFSFDTGEGLSEHTAPFDALVQVVDGEARITISGNDHTVLAGQAILMPANEPHAVYATSKMRMLLVMARD